GFALIYIISSSNEEEEEGGRKEEEKEEEEKIRNDNFPFFESHRSPSAEQHFLRKDASLSGIALWRRLALAGTMPLLQIWTGKFHPPI
ncbi:hypothetical protein FQA47_010823, partial [Oryzias melastigma]